ncbi:MAG TPA: amino acid adenylation domain-containing protein, partial [Longimicrobium sp.]
PAEPSFRGAFHTVLLPLSLYQELKELSRGEEVTLFMTLLAVFKSLLWRYTGQEDVIVGFPVTGRGGAETEDLIGPFVNTLALRTDLSGDPTFRELVKRVQRVALGAYEHAELPFERLVEAMQPERTRGHNPLFDVMFTLQNALPTLDLGPGLRMEFLQVDSKTAKFDLSLDIFEGPEGPTCIWEYSTDLFDADRMARMGAHFQTLLEGVVANPDTPISRLPLLTAPEREQLIHGWNDTRADYPLDRSFLEEWEAQVARAGDAVAVGYGVEELTYAELDRAANRMGHALRAAGVGRDTVVPILAQRSPLFLAGILAIYKAGGAYLPLAPGWPEARLRQIVDQSGAPLLLAATGCAPALERALALDPALPGRGVLRLEDLWSADAPETSPGVRSEPGDLAYVLFTSGSTGAPKGVMIEQKGMLNHLFVMNETLGLSPADVVAQTASQCFDISVWQFLSPLMVGGRVEIVPDEVVRDPARLLDTVRDRGVTVLEPVPSLLSLMIEETRSAGGAERLSTLRWVIPTGEALAPDLCRRWFELFPDRPLLNAYGPAECADDVTLHVIREAPDAQVSHMPIGTPVANMKVYLLDAKGEPVPVGVCGEIYVGGVGVGRGYLGDRQRTEESFLPDPFSAEPDARMYRTGDLARHLADGSLVFLGRADHQVKVRGFRIELGEIEAVLLRHAGVREASVVVREDAPGDQRIVAYVAGDESCAAGLRDWVRAHLPEYMAPAATVVLPEMPRTPNGKVDQKALPAPTGSRAHLEGGYVGPRTMGEEMLSEIWAQAFGIARVGIHDDFFHLGGHSMLAFQILARIRTAFDVELPLKSFFQTPTVAGLAAAIAERTGKRDEYQDYVDSLPVLTPDPERWHEPFPLTDVQQAYWIGRSGAFELGNVSTHNYDELEFEGLDLGRLHDAWQRLVQRHGMLRAVVSPEGEQRILETVPEYQIPVLDLRGLPREEVDARIAEVRGQMSHQVLDTAQWPVFDLRATLADGGLARLHFSTDSLTFDAWSFVVLIKELVTLHQDPAAELPPLELSFRDYVLAETNLRDSDRYRRSKEYWSEIIPNLPPAPELPLVKSPSEIERPQFTRLHDSLSPEVWQKLKARATRVGLTGTGILLAAYAETLAAWTRGPHFTLNLTFLHRHPMHPQVNDLVGEFTSLTLLEVDHREPDTFARRARRTQERLWSDLENHYFSGIQVLRELKRMHGGVTSAKMPVVFTSALTLPIPDREKTPVSLRPVHSITQTSQVLLDCGVWEDSGALFCNWDVVEELYPEGYLPRMFEAYFGLLNRLAVEDDIWQQEVIPLLPPSQCDARAAANQTGAPVPEGLLHTLFAQQVPARAGEPAVITTDRTLTYDEVYRAANQLGRWLRERGARPNTLVAVVMEKGWEQVVGTLGTLGSGAAYLPIDPDLPEERITYLLEHGEVELVLTQSWVDAAIEWPDTVQRVRVDVPGEYAHLSDEPLDVVQQQTDLAYVIFTSGSTGTPKGVMIDHRGAVNTIVDCNTRFDVGSGDRVLALSALNFDLSVYDIFGALAAGGAVVIPDAAARRDPGHWLDRMERDGVTIWDSVPALQAMLVEYATMVKRGFPASLRLVMLSGDWIPTELPGRIRELGPDLEVYSLGGATEASIWSILYPVTEVDPAWTSIPYGKPMVNQSFHVLNAALEPCPVWVQGQLYIGGIGLAQGYWRDAEKTASHFIVHPRTGERLYRTGDTGRYLPDGNIEFLGREDFQVKVQGFRIELGEIEAALKHHPSVRDAVVMAVGEQKGNKRLVAYVVPRDPAEAVSSTDLRRFLLRKIPEYMVPSLFVSLDELPLTENGKVNRKALPAGEQVAAAEQEFVPPASDTERRLAEIWSRLLGVGHIGRHSNFFTLGGDSMLSIQALSHIRSEFGADLPAQALFTTTSLAELAEAISDAPPLALAGLSEAWSPDREEPDGVLFAC